MDWWQSKRAMASHLMEEVSIQQQRVCPPFMSPPNIRGPNSTTGLRRSIRSIMIEVSWYFLNRNNFKEQWREEQENSRFLWSADQFRSWVADEGASENSSQSENVSDHASLLLLTGNSILCGSWYLHPPSQQPASRAASACVSSDLGISFTTC